ncbi:unannotated protein [freshwater metagenome]|uniref:Unannotated protein n=1 Tax=freshwater metagenome TaxID=449393 RepID=A0A6J7HUC6_9ZZZZ
MPAFRPPETGYSQSMSMPSKPYCFMNVTQDEAKSLREASDAAAAAKFSLQVQPPMEIIVLRPGLAALSLRS